MEDCSSRLEQAEDRISDLKDEKEIKGKIEELLLKKLKTCERNMQELTDSIIDIEEGEEVQAKRICNIFKKKIKKISQI
jgi:septal ring factor EnvC (AmiA/AmiB activator)